MSEATKVHGIVLSAAPAGESDRRLLILTKEYGKISAFAKGARRPGSALLACSQPFTLTEFSVYMGRSSNSVTGAENVTFFDGLRADMEKMCYGMYLCELADFFTREGNDESEMLNLLYAALRTMEKETVPTGLVRPVYELKAVSVFGEAPSVFKCISCGKELGEGSVFLPERAGAVCPECAGAVGRKGVRLNESALYAMQYTISTQASKVFSFNLTGEVERQFKSAVSSYLKLHVDRPLKSLEVMEQLGQS